jgi:thiamine-phosphate pyrophosphorylase
MTPSPICGLYAITPETEDGDWLVQAVGEALSGGARAIQYRFKHASYDETVRTARRLVETCRRHGRPLIVNDSVAVMLAADAHGVHLGRDDADPAQVRARIGRSRLIGVSCYDDFERALAHRDIADYFAFGSMFASAVKPGTVRAPLALLARARARGLATVAIGGIDAANAGSVIAAGADAIAVVTGVFGQPDVEVAASRLAAWFD